MIVRLANAAEASGGRSISKITESIACLAITIDAKCGGRSASCFCSSCNLSWGWGLGEDPGGSVPYNVVCLVASPAQGQKARVRVQEVCFTVRKINNVVGS